MVPVSLYLETKNFSSGMAAFCSGRIIGDENGLWGFFRRVQKGKRNSAGRPDFLKPRTG
jgi:hypothetical protein